MRVLFSPLGRNDPMTLYTSEEDGEEKNKAYETACLQIIRKYRPDKIYLYMSGEICKNVYEDEISGNKNRYVQAIELLKNDLKDHGLQYDITEKDIESIKRPELFKEVHEFDYFYQEFGKEIDNIIDKYGENTEILCNVTSGTPAMNQALQILCVLRRPHDSLSNIKLKPFQVTIPDDLLNTGSGRYIDKDENYSVDDLWKINADKGSMENTRVVESKSDQLFLLILNENIVRLLEKYDYEGAFALADQYSEQLNDPDDPDNNEIIDALTFAKNRYERNFKEIFSSKQKKFRDQFLPYYGPISETEKEEEVSNSFADDSKSAQLLPEEEAELFEYSLWLKLKVNKEDIDDFTRGINPFMYTRYDMILRKKFNINIKSYCDQKGESWWLSRKNLIEGGSERIPEYNKNKTESNEILNILDDYFKAQDETEEDEAKKKKYRNNFLTENQMNIILMSDGYKKELPQNILCALECLYKLKNIRNSTCHQITKTTREDIIENVKNIVDEEEKHYSPEDCIAQIKIILDYLGYDTENNWNSYDEMNKNIIDMLKNKIQN